MGALLYIYTRLEVQWSGAVKRAILCGKQFYVVAEYTNELERRQNQVVACIVSFSLVVQVRLD